MAKFCAWCGQPVGDNDVFCGHCGRQASGAGSTPAAQQVPQQPAPQTPQQTWQAPQQAPQQQVWQAPAQPQPVSYPPAGPAASGGGLGKGAIIGIVAAAVVALAAIAGFIWPGFFLGHKDDTPKPVETEDVSGPTDAPQTTPGSGQSGFGFHVQTPVPSPVATPYVNPFSDVSEDDYFYNAVKWAVTNGILSGTTFSPNELCSRAQAITFLWRSKGSPEPTLQNSPYADVSASDFFYKPVLWAFENGVTTTATDGQFHPDNSVTRSETVTFLWRAEGSPEKQNQGGSPFVNVTQDDWYYEPVCWAYEQGIIGRDDTYTFDDSADVNRAQYITFLDREYDEEAEPAATTDPEGVGFAAKGMPVIDAYTGATADFPSHTADDESLSTTAHVTVTSYSVTDADIPGWEWRTVEFRLVFNDANAKGYGAAYKYTITDYHDIDLATSTRRRNDDGDAMITVEKGGELYNVVVENPYDSYTTDSGERVFEDTYSALVPKGYDGVVIGFINSDITEFSSSVPIYNFYSPGQMVFFRMS